MNAQAGRRSSKEDAKGTCEQPLSTSLGWGGQFVVAGAASGAVSDTRAAAHLLRFKWLERPNGILERKGVPWVTTYPACARCKFGDGRPGKGGRKLRC